MDKLEAELLRYKDKMNDIEFFKSRVEELREDNRILVETKEMLEEQLASSRKRSEKILELENDIIRFKGDMERSQHERENDRMKIKDLMEENAALHLSQKNSVSESQSLLAEMEAMKGNYSGSDLNILSEQLGKDAVSRVHRLELDNQRLQRELEAARALSSLSPFLMSLCSEPSPRTTIPTRVVMVPMTTFASLTPELPRPP